MVVNALKTNNNTPAWKLRKQYPLHVKNKFKHYAKADIALYNHFVQIMKNKIKSQPKDFHNEVEIFKNIKMAVYKLCDLYKSRLQKRDKLYDVLPHYFPPTQETDGFNLTHDDCTLMRKNEIAMWHQAYSAQLQKVDN